MIRGTTAQFKFKMPYMYDDVTTIKIIFWQPGNNGSDPEHPLPIVKTREQCEKTMVSTEVAVRLNQDETLRFSEKTKAFVQLRAIATDGTVFATKQEPITVYPLYDDSILN